MDSSLLLDHTPQRPPQKIGWSILVAFLLYNDEKPDIITPRRQVAFDVNGASPSSTGPDARGISRKFTDHLEILQTKEKNTPYSESRITHRRSTSAEENKQDTISSLLDKKTQQEILLTCDSTIFELKEAISQRCNVSQVFSDTFCLVFERKVLPDWPSLTPKSLSELGLYDNCMVYAVEYDKGQYMLRETIATRLVLRATQERKRRLENAFDLAQDCLHSARGFASLVEEEAFPPLYMGKQETRNIIQNNNIGEGAKPKILSRQEPLSMQERLDELRGKRGVEKSAAIESALLERERNQTRILEAELDEAAATRPQTSNYSSTDYGRRKNNNFALLPQQQQLSQRPPTAANDNNNNTSSILSSPRNKIIMNSQSRFTPIHHAREIHNDLDNNNYNLGGWNNSSSSGDRMLKRKYGLRGEDREQSYREYFEDTPRKKQEAEVRGMSNNWFENSTTSEMD